MQHHSWTNFCKGQYKSDICYKDHTPLFCRYHTSFKTDDQTKLLTCPPCLRSWMPASSCIAEKARAKMVMARYLVAVTQQEQSCSRAFSHLEVTLPNIAARPTSTLACYLYQRCKELSSMKETSRTSEYSWEVSKGQWNLINSRPVSQYTRMKKNPESSSSWDQTSDHKSKSVEST